MSGGISGAKTCGARFAHVSFLPCGLLACFGARRVQLLRVEFNERELVVSAVRTVALPAPVLGYRLLRDGAGDLLFCAGTALFRISAHGAAAALVGDFRRRVAAFDVDARGRVVVVFEAADAATDNIDSATTESYAGEGFELWQLSASAAAPFRARAPHEAGRRLLDYVTRTRDATFRRDSALMRRGTRADIGATPAGRHDAQLLTER